MTGIDQYNANIEKAFVIHLLNEVEDYDSDGIENAYDPDDALFKMPTLGSTWISVKANGRIFLSSEFQTEEDASQLAFSFVIAEDRDFKRPIRTLPALVQGDRLHASLYNLKTGSVYYARVEASHRAKIITGKTGRFETPGEYVYWWQTELEVQGRWRQSSWFGNFLPHESGWIYHSEMQWLYANAGEDGDLWLWSDQLGWLWTTEGVYPHLYGHSKADWFYFLKKQDLQSLFYDYAARGFITIAN